MLFVGVDFPSLFEKDNFTLRRTTGHNMLDPESLISGAELAAGFDYRNSRRAWQSEDHYLQAVTGEINTSEILLSAPRVCLLPDCGCIPQFKIPNRLEALYELEIGTPRVTPIGRED